VLNSAQQSRPEALFTIVNVRSNLAVPGSSGNAAVAQALRVRAGYERGKDGSLSALLRSITTDAAEAESGQWLLVLDDLARTLQSFDEAHRGT
jgi:hypothetical protein